MLGPVKVRDTDANRLQSRWGRDVLLDAAGTRVWLAVQDRSAVDPAPSLLINATDFSVLQEFPKPVPDGTIAEWVQAAVFHPAGHLLFEGRDDFIDVYLIR